MLRVSISLVNSIATKLQITLFALDRKLMYHLVQQHNNTLLLFVVVDFYRIMLIFY